MVRSGWLLSRATVREVLLASAAAVLFAGGVGPAGTSVRGGQPPDTGQLGPAKDHVHLNPGAVAQAPPIPLVRAAPAPEEPRRPVGKDNVLLPPRGVLSQSQTQRLANAPGHPDSNQASPPPINAAVSPGLPPDRPVDGASNVAQGDTGACCFDPWGNCTQATESSCVIGGGRLKGVGTECSEGTCSGACCYGTSCGDSYGFGWCTVNGGSYQGDGTNCRQLTIACPPTTGACCIAGDCYQVTPDECTASAGTFLGLGLGCGDVSCTPPEIHGACCFPDGSCMTTSRARCAAAQGTHRGEGTLCEGDICSGACCFPWGCDDNSAPFWCGLDGGVFQAFGTRCTDVGIACQTGACCDDYSGDCWDSGPENCSGTFHGLSSSCAEVVCKGACCEWESCDEKAQLGCSGIFHGLGTSCESVNCPFGACCFDGPCGVRVEEQCTRDGGDFRGVGSRCEEIACTGACCAFSSSACIDEIGPLSCAQILDGVYQGDGSTCTDAHECQNTLGACCGSFGFFNPAGGDNQAGTVRLKPTIVAGAGSESCMDGVTAFECSLYVGEFREGMDCASAGCPDSLCPGLGECCTPHRSPGCNDATCCQIVCSIDPYCCFLTGLPWDDVCIDLANRLCGDGNGGYCAEHLADLNGDGVVDLLDYALFQNSFGQ